jgi:predicted cupin superfamily sugar epimerase
MARFTLLVCLVVLAVLSLFQGALASPTATTDHCRPKPIAKRTAQEVVGKLGLAANPEKGYYKETFRDTLMINTGNGTRSASTQIYYLLEGSAGESLWHRVDAVEVWHYYAGAPLTLSLSNNNGTGVRKVVLGPDVFEDQSPQVVIQSWEWQSAKSEGDWTLVGTTGESHFPCVTFDSPLTP